MTSPSNLAPLIRDLEGVLRKHAAVGVAFSPKLADERMRAERALLGALYPTHAANERRWHLRVNEPLHARLRTRGGPQAVAVPNIGSGGACIELASPPNVGDEVELELLMGPGTGGDMHVRFGQVVWASGSRAGLRFESGTEPLDQHLMRFIVGLLDRG